MDVEIPYGQKIINIKLDDQCQIILPNKIEIKDEEKIIQESLNNPINTEPFEVFLQKSEQILIIVNDASKPTPTSKILKHIYPALSKHNNFKILIATGTHKPPNEDQCRDIFGDFYELLKEKIYIHDAKNKDNMVYLGQTKSGTELFINRMVTDARNIIVIGSVEPHYFAGYTGGRKAFFPGVAAYKTVEMNHKFALSDQAITLCLKKNPIHNDLTDAIEFLNNLNIFSIQTVLTDDYKIYASVCGDIIDSFNQATKKANEVYCVPVKQKANIILTVVPHPMDINLYQSQHALENAKLVLEDNGILILVSKCRMGVGNEAFLDLLSKANTEDEVIKLIGGKYKLGSHKSIRILKIKSKAEIFAITDLDDNTIKKAKFKPFSDIQTAVDEAINLIISKGKKPNILIMPSGNLTIPIIRRN